MICIVDYGMGNLRSVAKAIEKVGGDVCVTSAPEAISNAHKVILPGVGAFGKAMQELRKRSLIQPLKRAMTDRKPFLGICLGLQLLFESSEESDEIKGLGVFPGRVVRFQPQAATRLKIPHMGWNQVQIDQAACPLIQGVPNGAYFYFVHSYYAQAAAEITLGHTEYGVSFASMLWQDNIYAAQFHPEKSQAIGLQILTNFVQLP